MKILATDLDRTLLPNGSWPEDPGAIDLFNELTEKHGVHVVYVTGRNLALSEDAIRQYGIRYPHVLIGDVGTSIRKYEQGGWLDDEGWNQLVRQRSPRWNAEDIRNAVACIDGLVEQAREHCGPFKQSYYVDHDHSAVILETVDARVKDQFDEAIVYSFDSQSGKGLLDFLPDSATKQTALEYIAVELGADIADVVFCGDSGNDVLPLTAGFCGVLVRNADEQLVSRVMQAARTVLEYTAGTKHEAAERVPVHSPITGKILKLVRECEGPVRTGEPLLEVGDPSVLEVEVDVLSADAVKIKPGMKVLFDRWGGDEPLQGVVRIIEPAGFTKISALGVEEQRVLVISDFTSAAEQWQRLGDGYRVEARFILWHEDDVLQVPASSLFRYQDGWAVFVIEDKRAKRRVVEVGQRNGLIAQIVKGLEQGETVINHPGDDVEDNARIKPRLN